MLHHTPPQLLLKTGTPEKPVSHMPRDKENITLYLPDLLSILKRDFQPGKKYEKKEKITAGWGGFLNHDNLEHGVLNTLFD